MTSKDKGKNQIFAEHKFVFHVDAKPSVVIDANVERFFSNLSVKDIETWRVRRATAERRMKAIFLVDVPAVDAVEEPIASRPPALGEALIALLAPKGSVESQLGDMQEIFERNKARVGDRRAKQLYWIEVLRSIGPMLFRYVLRAALAYGRSKLGL